MKARSLNPLYKASLVLASLLIAGVAQASPQAVIKNVMNGFEIGMPKEQAFAHIKKLGGDIEKVKEQCIESKVVVEYFHCPLGKEFKAAPFFGYSVDSASAIFYKDKLYRLTLDLDLPKTSSSRHHHERFGQKVFQKTNKEMKPLKYKDGVGNSKIWDQGDVYVGYTNRHAKDHHFPQLGITITQVEVYSKEKLLKIADQKKEGWFFKLRKYLMS